MFCTFGSTDGAVDITGAVIGRVRSYRSTRVGRGQPDELTRRLQVYIPIADREVSQDGDQTNSEVGSDGFSSP